MARGTRRVSENGMYHVLFRCAGRAFSTEADYMYFIAAMKDCFSKYGVLLVYIFLPNGIHIIFIYK